MQKRETPRTVIPAKAGIQLHAWYWIPAFAGMTKIGGSTTSIIR